MAPLNPLKDVLYRRVTTNRPFLKKGIQRHLGSVKRWQISAIKSKMGLY